MSRSKVLSIRAFIPARDLDVSRRFYQDLGFREIWGDDSACGMQIDDCGIILQKFYVDAWWRHIQAMDLKEKYGLGLSGTIHLRSDWGLVAHRGVFQVVRCCKRVLSCITIAWLAR
jgi:catechol 2,3-dioxygenase-like lactoylglutathione lyase family enzyme